MSPRELVYMSTYITINLSLGDCAVETGILTQNQSEMFWPCRQTMMYYAADALVHKIVVDLSWMVRVCLTSLTPKLLDQAATFAAFKKYLPRGTQLESRGTHRPITRPTDSLGGRKPPETGAGACVPRNSSCVPRGR